MPKLSGQIAIIGAGVMGRALAKRILELKLASTKQLWAVTKSSASARAVSSTLRIPVLTKGYREKLQKTSLVILAVKPNQAREVARSLRDQGLRSNAIVISIVTGVPIADLEEALAPKTQVIRAITNTPLLVGAGMTSIVAGSTVGPKALAAARAIFESVGRCVEIEESQCEAMTGLSASGPAYLYLIMEALTDGGVRVGLSRKQALEAVAQTVLGAARMVQDAGQHPASLREDVTTPAGCTIAGLLVMEDGKLRSILARAVEEATLTAKRLGAVAGSR